MTTQAKHAGSSERLHALDAVRAVMMMLGLVIHAACSYTTLPLQVWPYKDASTSVSADLLLFGIHVFRMPIFFVMGGFFACMLYGKRGAAGLLRNRATRILLPFAVGWVLLVPLVAGGFAFAVGARAAGLAAGVAAFVARLADGAGYGDNTMHLWFLYDLMWLYIAALLLVPACRAIPLRWSAGAMRGFDRLLCSTWRVLPLAAVSCLTLLPMQRGSLDTDTSFIPNPTVLLAYGVFFGFGWLLWHRRQRLATFTRHAWCQTLLGLVLLPVQYGALAANLAPDRGWHTQLATAAVGALSVWLLVFGVTGLFLRYLDRPLPKVRYLVDASYWIYLAHLPFMAALPGTLAHLDWPAEVKLLAELLIATPLLVVSYHYLVRATLIGVVLNGRRFVRVWPFGAEKQRIVEPLPRPASTPS